MINVLNIKVIDDIKKNAQSFLRWATDITAQCNAPKYDSGNNIQLTSGTLLSTPVKGTIEYDGVYLYFTTDDGNSHRIQMT